MKKLRQKRAAPAERALIRKVMRELARDQLQSLREQIQRTGSGLDVLRAIAVCAMRDVAMPEWLAIEFMERYRAVTHARKASWDEAFGRPYPKGAHLAARRTARTKGPAVYRAVEDGRRPGKGIGKVLFAEIAQEFGLNTTLVGDLYSAEKSLREPWEKARQERLQERGEKPLRGVIPRKS